MTMCTIFFGFHPLTVVLSPEKGPTLKVRTFCSVKFKLAFLLTFYVFRSSSQPNNKDNKYVNATGVPCMPQTSRCLMT